MPFPRLEARDYAAAGVVLLCLFVAYVLVPTPLVQYTAWLVVFSVWMAWFVLASGAFISVFDR
ncbi:hypothetical protein [Halorarius litoreus]|uniref:hypothetical protein n=1 Tax=Halorarius litoreus TaxID=2962676 RepID=UPI0020CD16BE|nr:hypothetical protein [Halorarius litoreus]